MQHLFSGNPDLKSYMGSVYGVSALGLASAGVGAKLHLDGYVHAGFLWTISQLIISLILFASAENSTKNSFRVDRFGLFLAFGFSSGVNVGSWIEFASRQAGYGIVSLDNQLVYDAFVLSALVFTVFTVAGLLASSEVLFLAMTVISIGSMIMFWTAIGSLFGLVGLMGYDLVYIRLGLVLMSTYILVDTWKIKSEAERGRKDVIRHSMV